MHYILHYETQNHSPAKFLETKNSTRPYGPNTKSLPNKTGDRRQSKQRTRKTPNQTFQITNQNNKRPHLQNQNNRGKRKIAIKYRQAPDIKERAEKIIHHMNWKHIKLEHVAFIRSTGSKAKYTIARCHALGKAMQIGMGRKKGFYLIEVISEKFDRLPEDEQTRVIIHELMHIPKSFGGGFIHHDKVHEKSVKEVYEKYCELKKRNLDIKWL